MLTSIFFNDTDQLELGKKYSRYFYYHFKDSLVGLLTALDIPTTATSGLVGDHLHPKSIPFSLNLTVLYIFPSWLKSQNFNVQSFEQETSLKLPSVEKLTPLTIDLWSISSIKRCPVIKTGKLVNKFWLVAADTYLQMETKKNTGTTLWAGLQKLTGLSIKRGWTSQELKNQENNILYDAFKFWIVKTENLKQQY